MSFTAQGLIGMMTALSMTCRDGDKLFEAGKYSEAEREYRAGAVKVVGPNFKLPATPGEGEGGVRSELYVKMEPWSRANLMGCCVGMAKCLLKRENKEMALAWLEEVNILYRNTYFSKEEPVYDWMDYTIDLPDLTFRRTVGLCLASEIFLSLGNTGTGVHRRWIACTSTINLSAKHRTPELKRLVDTRAVGKLTELRHPDPQQIPRVDLQVPGLQIRGSWAKLNVGKSGGVTGGRESFSSFIWKSRLYVAGGRKRSLGPWYRDIWVLDLKTRDVWRQLPEYPIEFRTSGMFIGWNMIVHGNKVILVTGRPDVDYFDLETETWGSFRTTYTPTPEDVAAGVKNKWPFPGKTLCDSTMQIANGKLYVFGGTHRTTNIGCNLFMELDLTSKIWRRLSGYPMAPALADYTVPGPRRSASSWISQDKQRFYVMFGQCDREGAKLNGELHAGDEAYAYDDMWSWNFEQEKWRRERLSGNPPCPRSEMSCTYNEKLNQVIVFGGYAPSLPTLFLAKNAQFHFSYFADTFIYETPSAPAASAVPNEPTLAAPRWKQVLTPGFPTYRCQAQLNCDPETGRTYLFGGFTNSEYVPCRKDLISRSFGDLWELRIDEPGGHFENVDLEEETRTAKAGPWHRCFTCGSAGPWKKCGGACNGRAFFCGAHCLKEGWKEHRHMHDCKKKD